jgi:hypothetical protein
MLKARRKWGGTYPGSQREVSGTGTTHSITSLFALDATRALGILVGITAKITASPTSRQIIGTPVLEPLLVGKLRQTAQAPGAHQGRLGLQVGRKLVDISRERLVGGGSKRRKRHDVRANVVEGWKPTRSKKAYIYTPPRRHTVDPASHRRHREHVPGPLRCHLSLTNCGENGQVSEKSRSLHRHNECSAQ